MQWPAVGSLAKLPQVLTPAPSHPRLIGPRPMMSEDLRHVTAGHLSSHHVVLTIE
jgi:hypothetical protein